MTPFKYLTTFMLCLFVAGFMFLLGIVTGRGTAPFTIDTNEFKNKVKSIAKTAQKSKEKKMAIQENISNLKVVKSPPKEELHKKSTIKIKKSLKKKTLKDLVKYTIQTGAYTKQEDALFQIEMLRKKGFDFYIEKIQNDNIILYRTRIGIFNDLEKAKQVQNKLTKINIKSNVVKKDD